MVGRQQRVAALVVLGLLCAVLYARTLSFEFTRTDDTVQLLDNWRFVGSLDNVPAAFTRPFFAANGAANYYRPLVAVSYMLDAQWTGIRPFGYHCIRAMGVGAGPRGGFLGGLGPQAGLGVAARGRVGVGRRGRGR